MSDVLANLIYGERKNIPVKVWIESKTEPRRWWFGKKTVYYVCTEFMSQGPFSRRDEACDSAASLQLAMRH